jgi:hypothetical protein
MASTKKCSDHGQLLYLSCWGGGAALCCSVSISQWHKSLLSSTIFPWFQPNWRSLFICVMIATSEHTGVSWEQTAMWLYLGVIIVIYPLSSWCTCLCKCRPLGMLFSIMFHHIPFIPAMHSLVVHSPIHLILVFPYVVTPSTFPVCPWLRLLV